MCVVRGAFCTAEGAPGDPAVSNLPGFYVCCLRGNVWTSKDPGHAALLAGLSRAAWIGAWGGRPRSFFPNPGLPLREDTVLSSGTQQEQ